MKKYIAILYSNSQHELEANSHAEAWEKAKRLYGNVFAVKTAESKSHGIGWTINF